MNYLAHFYLADDTSTSICGALLGDFVKGNDWQQLPTHEQIGVLLHRRIDSWTDNWVRENQLTLMVPKARRRLCGIALDVYMDHLLANQWQNWHQAPLLQFSQQVYLELSQTSPEFAPWRMIENMSQYNWLCSYQSIEVIERALSRIGERFRRPQPLAELLPHFESHRAELEAHFEKMLPTLRACCQAWAEELG